MTTILLAAVLAISADASDLYLDAPLNSGVPLSGGTMTGDLNMGGNDIVNVASVVSGASTCTGDAVQFDSNGVQGCPQTTNVAPPSMVIHPPDNYRAGTQTAAATVVRGGIDEKTAQIGTAANCATDNFVITCGLNNTVTTCTLTENTHWFKTDGNNNATATSLGAAADTCACVNPDLTDVSAATVRVTPALAAEYLTISTNDATCLTLAAGTDGNVIFASPALAAQDANGPCMRNAASAAAATGGGFLPNCSDNDTVVTGVAGQVSVYPNGVLAGNFTSSGFSANAGLAITVGFTCSNPTTGATCADSGNGSAAACTLTSSDVRCAQHVTCSDADGCNLTLDETSAASVLGGLLSVVNLSANAVSIPDSAGVQETASPSLGQYDSVILHYIGDRWIQLTPVQNN